MHIVVGVVTYRRPERLRNCLGHLVGQRLPDNCSVDYLVVDNDPACSGKDSVEPLIAAHPNLHYVVEERKGIPVARNRALHEAIDRGADALCFIDDDEHPAADWLVQLVQCWQTSNADMVGGPVMVAQHAGLSLWQRFVLAGLVGRAARKAAKTKRAALTGQRFTVLSNNWLCDLDWLSSHNIRFDEQYIATGGSDTAFFRTARSAGCKAAWCSQAIVYESVPDTRLSLRYHFKRSAFQSMTHFHMKYPDRSLSLAISTLPKAALRAAVGGLLFVLPVLGWESPVAAIRSIGWAVGRLQALRGKKSSLYA